MAKRLAPAFLLAFAALAACGDDSGCGGAPAEKQEAPQTGKAAGGGGSAGSGTVRLAGPKEERARKASQADTAKEQLEEAAAESEAAKNAAPIPPTGNRSFQTQVLKAKKPVLVFVTGAGCEECDWASPAVDRAAYRAKADWDFYALDAFSTGATSLLPGDMKPLPLPKLLLYDKGTPFSRREGLPFPRDKGEALEAYRKRLTRWLSAALSRKNLAFGPK